MSTSNPIEPTRRGRSRVSSGRLGDVALFLLFAAQGTIGAVRAVRLGIDGDVIGAAHLAIVATALFIFGAFFVLRQPAAKRSRGLLPKLAAFVGSWSIVVLSALPLTWRPDAILNLSTFGLIAAYCWVIWSVLTLRRNLSIFPEARQLVRHGPYGLVRHPLYTGHIVCYVLIALPRLGIWAVLLAALGVAGELWRARNEERLLGSVFPEYAAYAASTPRYLPRLRGQRTTAVAAGATSMAAVDSR